MNVMKSKHSATEFGTHSLAEIFGNIKHPDPTNLGAFYYGLQKFSLTTTYFGASC
jgi:hypothetical protein